MDRRAAFFLIAAAACGLLYFPTPAGLRFVPAWLGVVYVVLALLSTLDYWSRRSEGNKVERRETQTQR